MSLLSRHKLYLWQNYLLYGTAFLFPIYPRFVPLLLLLFGVLSLVSIVSGYSRANMTSVGALMVAIYALHALAMLWTDNMERGLFDLEVKFSLLAIPLAFVGFRFLNTTNFTNTLRMIYWGALVAAVLCEAMAVYNYHYGTPPPSYRPYHFFYLSLFTVTMHHSYYSLYASFAILIYAYLHWPLFMGRGLRGAVTDVFVLLFLSLTIVQSGSKIGYLIWAGLLVSIALFLAHDMRRHKWLPILALLLIGLSVAFTINKIPPLQTAVTNVLKVVKNDEASIYKKESTYVRKLIYENVWEVISKQPWYGQGTGDHQDALNEVYEMEGLELHTERHFNAHNLFLQTWLSTGIPGLVLVVTLFVAMLRQVILSRGRLYLGFVGMFLFISMTESTFNVQAGVVFFSFFAVLFARRPSHDYLDKEENVRL